MQGEEAAQDPTEKTALLRCDFCGEEVQSVRRVALDTGYDRLQTPHREQYACPACSERKERTRRGL
jgi:hypothetical protein